MNWNTSVPCFYVLYVLIFIPNFQYVSNFDVTILVEIFAYLKNVFYVH